ncbi:ribosome maturation factor RimP [Varibaculum prostatecancerukia]|uniref:ribosome maturation factor RimP n=1 Tax=Varibaculum prostatecancerukia TaxID=2811781 RepID=UPI001C007A8B|nr:ribosome maturation factor RimP [Varibaculum prostatecancerukia]
MSKAKTKLEDELYELLTGDCEDAGLFLEDVSLKRAGKYTRLVVTVDLPRGPGAVREDQLSQATLEISRHLDEVDPINGTYNLEVTTPGIERPLRDERQFSRAIGHQILVKRCEGTNEEGKLVATTTEEIELETAAGQRTVPLKDIAQAQMVVKF